MASSSGEVLFQTLGPSEARLGLRVDLEDFFPSINFGRVFGLFKAYPFEYPPDVASLLAQLCCFDNELPQGSSDLPIISNFICRGLDASLGRLARFERCYYTRYADDLCFSTRRRDFPTSLAFTDSTGALRAGPAIASLVTQNGFVVNDAKTRLMRITQRQRVTGLVVNHHANVDRRYVRGIRNLLYIWKRYGKDDAAAAFSRANPGSTGRPTNQRHGLSALFRDVSSTSGPSPDGRATCIGVWRSSCKTSILLTLRARSGYFTGLRMSALYRGEDRHPAPTSCQGLLLERRRFRQPRL